MNIINQDIFYPNHFFTIYVEVIRRKRFFSQCKFNAKLLLRILFVKFQDDDDDDDDDDDYDSFCGMVTIEKCLKPCVLSGLLVVF